MARLKIGIGVALLGWFAALGWQVAGSVAAGWLGAVVARGGGLLLLLLPFRSAADADDWEPNASDFDDDEDDGKPLRVYVEAEYTIR